MKITTVLEEQRAVGIFGGDNWGVSRAMKGSYRFKKKQNHVCLEGWQPYWGKSGRILEKCSHFHHNFL